MGIVESSRFLAAAVLLGVAGCSGDSGSGSHSSPVPETSSAATSEAVSAEPVRRSLRVDWKERADRWTTLFRVSLGPGDGRLGVKRFPDQEPIVPSAFVPMSNGTFAVMDPAKRRIVSLDSKGKITDVLAEVRQQASDLAFDRAANRLLWIDFEPDGELGEISLTDGEVRRASADRPLYRLVEVDDSVLDLGAKDHDSRRDGFTVVPAPIEAYPASDQLAMETVGGTLRLHSTGFGDLWTLTGEDWATRLRFVGVNGPKRPVLALNYDLTVAGDSFVSSPVVGSYSSAGGWANHLRVLVIDLSDGGVQANLHVEQCGLTQDENVVSRVSIEHSSGDLYQLCVGRKHVEIRRGPNLADLDDGPST